MDRIATLPLVFLILMIAVSLPVLLSPPLYVMVIMLILYVAFFFGFSFTHGFYTFGGKTISVFFVITALTTYVMEWLGTHFGIPFGHYYYTNQLGPLLMEVPIVIPLQWFNMLYVCYIMANIAFGRNRTKIESTSRSARVGQILFISVVVGLFMVSWDFINDPYMVGVGSWVWTDPMEFFMLSFHGIPLSNFLGWILTGAIAVFLFELYTLRNREPAQNFMDKAVKPINGLVLVPYLYQLFVQVSSGIVAGVFSFGSTSTLVPIGLALVTMGSSVLLTGWRFNQIRS